MTKNWNCTKVSGVGIKTAKIVKHTFMKTILQRWIFHVLFHCRVATAKETLEFKKYQ